jgi:hypothetical protein
MAPVLDVWVAKPGSACLVDDGDWLVRVYDAHGNIFQRDGKVYDDLPAPHGHWAGTIPPGCYVVQAFNKNTGIETDHAIITVECAGTACVHLFVGGKQPEGPCKIVIKEVTGIGAPIPSSIHIKGTAANCDEITVGVTCSGGQMQTIVVPVFGGAWAADIGNSNQSCKCGGRIAVLARCVKHPDCADKFASDRLQCGRDKKTGDKRGSRRGTRK